MPAEPAAFESAAYFAVGTSQNIIGAVLGRFSGAIDEVRIWSRALSAAEIAGGINRQISSAPDLVAGWSFDTRNGLLTPESTGSSLEGVMVHGALIDAGIVDMGGRCVLEPTGACGVDGVVHYYRDSAAAGEPSTKPVPAIEIDVGPDGLVDATTDVNGAYTIPAVAGNLDVTTVDKFGSFRAADHNGAVTSFDASFIARHSIGQHHAFGEPVLRRGRVGKRPCHLVRRREGGPVRHGDHRSLRRGRRRGVGLEVPALRHLRGRIDARLHGPLLQPRPDRPARDR